MFLIKKNRVLLSIIAFIVIALLLVVFSISARSFTGKGETMKAMNCFKYTKEEFNARIKATEASQIYQPQKDAGQSVKFQFNLADQKLQNTLLVIKSNVLERVTENNIIFRGPYANEISIPIDDALSKSDNAHDILRFEFFNRDTNQLCVEENDIGYAFWTPGALVEIEFLDQAEENQENGLLSTYKVQVKPK